jgi:hypothetical protein
MLIGFKKIANAGTTYVHIHIVKAFLNSNALKIKSIELLEGQQREISLVCFLIMNQLQLCLISNLQKNVFQFYFISRRYSKNNNLGKSGTVLIDFQVKLGES